MNYRLFSLLVFLAFSLAVFPTLVSAQLVESVGGLVVVDSTDQELGPVIGVVGMRSAVVALDVNGVLFAIKVYQDEFEGNASDHVWFDSSNCSGSPFMDPLVGEIPPIIPHVRVSGPGKTAYVPDPNRDPKIFTNRSLSILSKNGTCESFPNESQTLLPAIAVVDLLTIFTPPFIARPMTGTELNDHTHTYQTGKSQPHNRITANTGPAEPAAP